MKFSSQISLLFIVWFISTLVIFYLGYSTLPHSGYFSNNFWESFGNWDGGHYTSIARVGYGQKYQYAFFPLYPLIIRAVNLVTHNFIVSGVLISIIAGFLGMNLLFQMLKKDFSKEIAEKTVISFLFFPTSFYLLTAYSEGLFFFLAVLTFYFLGKNKLLLASLTAALASATRLAGLAVVAGLLTEVMIMQKLNWRNWYVLLSLSGFLLYCLFLFQKTGDPFYFITAENHWQRSVVVPGLSFWETLQNLGAPGFIGSHFNVFLDLLFAILGAGLAIRAWRFLPAGFAIYSFFSVAIPLLTPTLSSIPRFLLPIFPFFILIAKMKNTSLVFLYQMLSVMLLSIFAVLFINGYWVS